jgi:hypothetical protein
MKVGNVNENQLGSDGSNGSSSGRSSGRDEEPAAAAAPAAGRRYPASAVAAAQQALRKLQGKRLECTIRLEYLVKKRKNAEGLEVAESNLRPYIVAVRELP